MIANPLDAAGAKSRVYEKLEQAEALASMMCGEGFSNNELAPIQQDSLRFLLSDLIRAAQSDFGRCFATPATVTPPQKAWSNDSDSILASYRQTVDGAAHLVTSLKCANLKRLSIVDREAIERAIVDMDGHIAVAREDFLGGVDHE